jgi:hypothetical protein
MKWVLLIMVAQPNISMTSAEFDSQSACVAAFDGLMKDFTARYADYLKKSSDEKVHKLPSPAFISYHCAQK